ncbi:Trypsin [Popillia japonica]|uniref:Trypsin n=1 Tax=Popillia japonica TaxID=7064 RepID=A0AAW1KJY8_POPJA
MWRRSPPEDAPKCLTSVATQYHPAGFNIYDRSPGERCGRSNKSICTTVFNCPTATKKLKAGLPHGLEKCGYQGVNEVVCCPDLQSKTAAACRRYFKEYKSVRFAPFITEGDNATLGDFPYAAALGFPKTIGEILLPNETSWECGAAHCVVQQFGNRLPKIVRLGKVDLEGDEDQVPAQEIPVSKVEVHPNFNYINRQNDLALLELSWPANFTDYVKPVCLSTEDNIPPNLVIIGWGATETDNYTISRFLKKGHTKLYDFNKCVEKYSTPVKSDFNTRQFCALSDPVGDRTMREDACLGDSGGPIQFENTKDNGATPAVVVGVVSFGRGCGGDEDQVPAQEIPVSKVEVHPNFNYINRQNDLALLELSWPANFTDYVKPVCLSTEDNIPPNLVIIGWGATETDNYTISRFLKKGHTKLYDFNKCVEKYSTPVKSDFNTRQFCALSDPVGDRTMREDACLGDSGGPIQFENTKDNGATPAVVVGVVSFGRGCGGDTPSIYTKVSEFIDWIEDIVWP